MCCMSRHPNFGFASSVSATIAAAIGAEADVPVCDEVHWWRKSVVITCFSVWFPEEYVEARVEEHGSEYQGIVSCSEVDDTDIV